MKDKNYIGKQNNYVFKLNRHHRTLDVSTDGYKKKDILKMLKSESGTITSYWRPNCRSKYIEHYFTRQKYGYQIGCCNFTNIFLSKIKNALLTMK
jgi:hypothetical protein